MGKRRTKHAPVTLEQVIAKTKENADGCPDKSAVEQDQGTMNLMLSHHLSDERVGT